MSKKDHKYRMAISLPQIHYLSALLRADTKEETISLREALSTQLKLLAFKAEEGITAPAYAASPRASIEEKLGLEDVEERRLLAYRKWASNPSLCTAQEIADANTYRYTNDMMTIAEEEEYENGNA